MAGVERAGDGTWSWAASCGAAGGDTPASRDKTREAFAAHRKKCRACQATNPTAAAAEKEKVEPAAAKPVVVAKKAAVDVAKKAAPVTATVPKALSADRERFIRLVKEAESMPAAWLTIKKEFGQQYGKVRAATLALTPEYSTFVKAYTGLTGKAATTSRAQPKALAGAAR